MDQTRLYPESPMAGPDPHGELLRGAGERVLIAACADDDAAAVRLRDGLDARGFAARVLTVSADDAALRAEIRDSDFIVVLLSTAAVPLRSRPVPELARVLAAVGALRGHVLYMIPARLDRVEPGPLEADHLQVIDLESDWDRGEGEIARLIAANFGRWDLESRHFMILGFATLFLASALTLALVVLPRVADVPSLRGILLGGGLSIVWLYGTFLASAWIGNRLGRWARSRRLEREWAWRGFVGLWVAAVLALMIL
jgi:hypothetical protein